MQRNYLIMKTREGKKEERKRLTKTAVPKIMSVALIEPFDRWFLSLSKGSETTRRNEHNNKRNVFNTTQ